MDNPYAVSRVVHIKCFFQTVCLFLYILVYSFQMISITISVLDDQYIEVNH